VRRGLLELVIPGALVIGLCLWCCHDLLPLDFLHGLGDQHAAMEPQYRVHCLDWGTLSVPMEINAAGFVAGVEKCGRTGYMVPVTSEAAYRSMPEVCSGQNVRSISVNDAGRVVLTTDSRPREMDERQVYLLTPEKGEVCSLDLERAGVYFSGYAISDSGVIVGASLKKREQTTWRAAAYDPASGFVQLDSVASCAFDINARGQVVGCAEAKGGQVARLWERDPDGAWLSVDLTEPLPPTTRAAAINDDGLVVGWIGAKRAFKWDAQRGLQMLPPPPECSVCRATAVNNHGQIVGIAVKDDGSIGITWQDGRPVELNDLIDPHSPYRIWQAHAINDAGAVACTAWCSEFREAVVLVPLDS